MDFPRELRLLFDKNTAIRLIIMKEDFKELRFEKSNICEKEQDITNTYVRRELIIILIRV